VSDLVNPDDVRMHDTLDGRPLSRRRPRAKGSARRAGEAS
jgi:hypothetical protein